MHDTTTLESEEKDGVILGGLKTEEDGLIMINYRCCRLLLQRGRVKVIGHLNTIRLTLTY